MSSATAAEEDAFPGPTAATIDACFAQLAALLDSADARAVSSGSDPFVDAPDLPAPFHALLNHTDNMTPTLSQFYHERTVSLAAHRIDMAGDVITRLITLRVGLAVVELALIRIHLSGLPTALHEGTHVVFVTLPLSPPPHPVS